MDKIEEKMREEEIKEEVRDIEEIWQKDITWLFFLIFFFLIFLNFILKSPFFFSRKIKKEK